MFGCHDTIAKIFFIYAIKIEVMQFTFREKKILPYTLEHPHIHTYIVATYKVDKCKNSC